MRDRAKQLLMSKSSSLTGRVATFHSQIPIGTLQSLPGPTGPDLLIVAQEVSNQRKASSRSKGSSAGVSAK